MYHLDQGRGRPDRLLKIGRVMNDELLNIHNIGDEENVEEKETNEDPIQLTLREGTCFVFHAYL
jgi:hypothetical protein